MVSFPSPASYKFNTFKGIRTRNGISSGGVISATECINVDFVPSSYDAGVVIQTTKGNIKTLELTDTYADYTIIKGFEFESEGVKYQLLYCENEDLNKGVLLKNVDGVISLITETAYNSNEPHKANGITMLDNAYNTFVFTNGVEYWAWCPDGQTVLQQLHPQYDFDGDETLEDVTGFAMCEQDGSLVIGCNEGLVLASEKGDITNWNYNDPASSVKPWFQLFGKPVTAVVPYIDALLVFTQEDSTVLTGNFSTTTDAVRKDASLGGCMSFESWVKHDKYIFFYDNKQKNLYYYLQNDYGQKVLGEPIAPEVQKYFNNITRLQMISYIGNNRSEIWLLSNSFKLIYDYFIGEWTERQCQELTSYFVFDNNVYSTGVNKVFKEKTGNICVFGDEFYPSKYAMQLINLGSFSNMKEMEIQPLVSVTADFNNTFYIDCEIDGKKVKTKYVKAYNNGAVWGDDTNPEKVPDNEKWAFDTEQEEELYGPGQVFPSEDDSVIQQIKGKFISNWYYLRFAFRTNARSDDFSITGFELKGITQETDTTGRK